tara:strand:+ start:286 stop:642 length:357 start_codon:yes stop_codon:yes gene_type:complete
MIYIILSVIIYTLFGVIGIFAAKKINFIKKNFKNKQNIIYLSIFFIVFGFFLGQYDPGNTGVAYQVGYGVGNYVSCFVGAIIATFLTTNFKFSFQNITFYYALFGSISLGTVLLLFSI